MAMVKATKDRQAGRLPAIELLAAMGRSNEERIKSGIMDHPPRRTNWSLGRLWQAKDMAEAVAWVQR
jgi:hypothetical protein